MLFLFSFLYSFAAAQKPYWQQQVNYRIVVTLNDVEHSLTGQETMEYMNNSNDTLRFIWVHIWPNAFKNDRTAFTTQQLENGSTSFYFSEEKDKGYINRLAFKVNGVIAVKEDHPQHQDIIKLVLPEPLAPKKKCIIETPFFVKLPYNFSRGGHVGQAYQITQWYPKAAVYDRKGWHEMPYLDQGEFYSDFGDYEVSITLPENYVVAATGELIKESIQPATGVNKTVSQPTVTKEKKPFLKEKKQTSTPPIPSSSTLKTLVYKQENVIDFAWFADKNFTESKDTVLLPSGKIVTVASYSLPPKENNGTWKSSLKHIKKSILQRSKLIGEYPYNTATIVQANTKFAGGMEYPTITLLSSSFPSPGLIGHEIGHNWFMGILATNEREHPWMDEGMNTYYEEYRCRDTPLIRMISPNKKKETFFEKRMPENFDGFLLQCNVSEKRGQAIETLSEKFSMLNYELCAYYKAGKWMQWMEKTLGREMFDSCMREYYRQWKFKHPYPEDFKQIVEKTSSKNLDTFFYCLKTKDDYYTSSIDMSKCFGKQDFTKRPVKLTSFFSFKDTDKYKYIFASPAIGMNKYDKLMLGAMLHNYTLPQEKFSFLLATMYATGSKQLNGTGRIDYKLFQGSNGGKIILSLAGGSFSYGLFTDSVGNKNNLRFSKIVPGIKYVLPNNDLRSHLKRYIEWKAFFINEESYLFTRDTINDADVITYPSFNRYVNQLRFMVENSRALYPYNATVEASNGNNFLRLSFTGNYFFNYPKGGGMNVRLFAGKFFYMGEKTIAKSIETDPYQLNMTGPRGYEDYTYSNYFAGRSEFDGFASQQIMQRDGFFKVGTDMLSNKIGKSDNWVAAANFTSDFPKSFNPLSVLPIKIPLKIFVDIGTYAQAWKKNSEEQKLIYDAGLQLSLFKNTVNIYAPILYSKVYRDYIKSTHPGFFKNISFSIDIQNITFKKLIPQFAF